MAARAALTNVIPPRLSKPETAAALVFAAARYRGPIARDTIADDCGLSFATVHRYVTALLDAQLLRERPDLSVPGAIGRPRVPLELNHDRFLTLGIHVGVRTTIIVASDLFGRSLGAVEMATPGGPPSAALASLAESSRRYLTRWHKRRPLWVGLTSGGIVDSVSGHIDHPQLGWPHTPAGPTMARGLGLPVSVAWHVDAMAGAELLLRKNDIHTASSLYLYARETVGFAQVIDGRVHTPASGPGTIAALPVHSDLLGDSGRLESTVSDDAVISAARKRGILPTSEPNSTIAELLGIARQNDGPTSAAARELLAERARILGGAVALLRDILNPQDIVVGGQAFTDYPEGMQPLTDAFAERSLLPKRQIRLTRFGGRVQEAGAGIVSLSALYADPLGALRRAQSRRRDTTHPIGPSQSTSR